MAYITADNKEVKVNQDFNLCTITDVEETTSSKGKPLLWFHFKKDQKSKDGNDIIFKKVMFDKLIDSNITIYSALEKAFGMDRVDGNITREHFIDRQVCINDKISPIEPTRADRKDPDKVYDNYKIWDVYLPESGPNRTQEEYLELCDRYDFDPKTKSKKDSVSDGDGFDDFDKKLAEDAPY